MNEGQQQQQLILREEKRRNNKINEGKIHHHDEQGQKQDDTFTSTSSILHISPAIPRKLYLSSLSPSLRYTCAPLVGLSDLPFRMLCRTYGAGLIYTQMIESEKFVSDEIYRREIFHHCILPAQPSTHSSSSSSSACGSSHSLSSSISTGQSYMNDRPLVVQFCANRPDIFIQAAKMVQPYCDAVDLNLGCPQRIARTGHYGSFLLDNAEDRSLVCSMISSAAKQLDIPVFCKIRLLMEDEEVEQNEREIQQRAHDDLSSSSSKRSNSASLSPPSLPATLSFCQSLQRAGCSLIAIHGRTRGSVVQRRMGPADLHIIRSVRESLSIPVLSNGNVYDAKDVKNNLDFTGAAGIMVGEALLANPAIFQEAYQLEQERSGTIHMEKREEEKEEKKIDVEVTDDRMHLRELSDGDIDEDIFHLFDKRWQLVHQYLYLVISTPASSPFDPPSCMNNHKQTVIKLPSGEAISQLSLLSLTPSVYPSIRSSICTLFHSSPLHMLDIPPSGCCVSWSCVITHVRWMLGPFLAATQLTDELMDAVPTTGGREKTGEEEGDGVEEEDNEERSTRGALATDMMHHPPYHHQQQQHAIPSFCDVLELLEQRMREGYEFDEELQKQIERDRPKRQQRREKRKKKRIREGHCLNSKQRKKMRYKERKAQQAAAGTTTTVASLPPSSPSLLQATSSLDK